jgi:hypothetical protein
MHLPGRSRTHLRRSALPSQADRTRDMNWPAILNFIAELGFWVAIAFGGSIVFMVVWALIGIGSRKQSNERSEKNDGEVGGLVGRVHDRSNYNNPGAE